MTRPPAALMLAAALVSGAAQAQAQATSTISRPCVDSLQAVDSLRNIISAVVETTDYYTQAGGPRARRTPWTGSRRGLARIPRHYLNLVVDEIASRITVPDGIMGGAFVPMRYRQVVGEADTMYLATPAVRASFLFTVRSDGRVGNIDLWGSTLNHGLEESVWRAILGADSARAIPPLPPEIRGSELLLKITVEPEQFFNQPPSARFATRSDFRPLFRASRPVLRVNSLPERALYPGYDDMAALRFPPTDTVQFVVAETGAVLPGTLFVSSVRYLQESEAALGQIVQLSHAPARSGDCVLPTLVQIPLR